MPRSVRTVVLLLLALSGLLTARSVHTTLNLDARDYYEALSNRPLALQNPGELVNCAVATCIEQLSQVAPPEGIVRVGACDLFMYNGGVAVSGFLTFLTVYFAFVLAGFFLHGVAPARLRGPVLLAWSLLFLILALPIRPTLWLLEATVALFILARLPLSGRIRAGLLLVGGAIMLGTVGRSVVEATAWQFFRLNRLPVALDAYPLGKQMGDVMVFLHLGVPGSPPKQLEGYPYLFLALAFLIKGYRRILWLAHDLWVGRTQEVHSMDFLLYFLGLPTLIGNAATPPYQEFVESRGREPGPLAGATTLAVCVGLVSVLYTLVVMLGYSPAVRVLFPRCDLVLVGTGTVWLRLSAVYVIEYLFLLATEQASIGVARLFGYGLRDNYEQPLAARSIADYWRRWNIYWREFMVTVFFWPTALALARRYRRPEDWHLVLAALLTFSATFCLNVLPLFLVSGFLQEQFFVGQGTQPGPGLVEPGVEPQHTSLGALVPSLAVYYALEGLLVSGNLLVEFWRSEQPLAPATPGLRRALQGALATVFTFALVAALRVFLTDSLSLRQQLDMLRKALFLY